MAGRNGYAALLAAAGILWAAAAAGQPAPQPAFREIVRPPSPAAALDEPLAARLAGRLAQVWFDSAEPQCRARNGLDRGAYDRVARAVLVAAGEHMEALAASAVDAAKADAAFRAEAGPQGLEEMGRLAADPTVAEFLALLRRQAAVERTTLSLDNIDRALLLARVAVRRQASPIATGDDADLLLALETVSEAPLDFIDANRSAPLERFLELWIIATRVLAGASDRDALLLWGPGRLMPLLAGPLAAHCIAVPR